MIKEAAIVIPGQKIAASEELLPGYGTFDDGKSIRGSIIGRFAIDNKKMSAELKPLTNTPSILKEGESVICEVKGMMESMIIVEIIHVPGKKRSISGLRSASIHISNLAEGYVEEIGKEYRMGDIIRAKVIQAKPSVRLSTVGREYGVIKSFCMRCRHPLKKKGSALECPRCGRVETRKMAIDYGEGNLDLVVK